MRQLFGSNTVMYMRFESACCNRSRLDTERTTAHRHLTLVRRRRTLENLAGHKDLRMVTQTYRHDVGGVIDGGASRAGQLFAGKDAASAGPFV